jgi:hypothetical protein
MSGSFALLGGIPVLVLLVFGIHWSQLLGIRNSSERLARCRGLYLSLSIVMTLVAWALFFLYAHRANGGLFIPVGATFALVGDYFNLQFKTARRITGENPVFGGTLAFCAVQVCYILAFFLQIDIAILVASGVFVPLVVVLVLVPVAIFFLRVYKPALSIPMVIASLLYSILLGLMTTIAMSGVMVNGGAWFMIGSGAALFMVSDAVMADTTVRGRHPPAEYQIPWITYLGAQALILYGFVLQFA